MNYNHHGGNVYIYLGGTRSLISVFRSFFLILLVVWLSVMLKNPRTMITYKKIIISENLLKPYPVTHGESLLYIVYSIDKETR